MTPPHAFTPDQTPRHPEDLLDPIKKKTVFRGMTPDTLAASEAWRTGLRFYCEGYFWEAQEVLNAVWIASCPNTAERRMVHAMRQLSNAALKSRMGREAASRRLCAIAAVHLSKLPRAHNTVLGISVEWVQNEIERRGDDIDVMQYNANLDFGGI